MGLYLLLGEGGGGRIEAGKICKLSSAFPTCELGVGWRERGRLRKTGLGEAYFGKDMALAMTPGSTFLSEAVALPEEGRGPSGCPSGSGEAVDVL